MKVNIKGKKYAIKFVDIIDCNDKIDGQTRPIEKEILIRNDLSGSVLIESLAHELYHAYSYECGLREAYEDEDLIYWLGYIFEDLTSNFDKIYEDYKEIMKSE